MPKLTCEISESLMNALAARQSRTGEPMSHIVMTALADALGVEHATLFQVSTSAALVEGVYQGVVTIAELRQHGNFGLGTFESLDGEMVAVDGRFYQARESGEVAEPVEDAQLPFALVTTFRADRESTVESVGSLDSLSAHLDLLRRTDNLFCAVELTGRFSSLRGRAVCRARPGQSLVTAARHQSEFTLTNVVATLIGFWTPTYARSIGITGWHLHFLTEDRCRGGHVLDCQSDHLKVEIQDLVELRVALPETAAFLQADLRRDPSNDLDVAEHGASDVGNDH